jgi:transposase
MWTEITRPKYERKGLGYSSDLGDAEWAMIEPPLPRRNRLGRPPKTEIRRVVKCIALYGADRLPMAAAAARGSRLI